MLCALFMSRQEKNGRSFAAAQDDKRLNLTALAALRMTKGLTAQDDKEPRL